MIPSYQFLFGQEASNVEKLEEPPKPPTPPAPPALTSQTSIQVDAKLIEEKVKGYTQEVIAYTQQVAAYNQQVNAFKTHAELAIKSRGATTYEMVVKGTLQPLLSAILTAFLTWVFANVGASLADNYVRAKNNQPLQPIKFW